MRRSVHVLIVGEKSRHRQSARGSSSRLDAVRVAVLSDVTVRSS